MFFFNFLFTASCLQGFKRDGEPGTCVRCEKGTYQDEKWQTSCKSCGGVRYMTMNDAATQKSDCICKYSQISFSPNCKETRSVILISKKTRRVVLICKGTRSTDICT